MQNVCIVPAILLPSESLIMLHTNFYKFSQFSLTISE